MPIYEFRCDSCEGRFEALVAPGAESVACRLCGAAKTTRVLSAQAAPMSLVKPPGARRKHERRNQQLRRRTKTELAAARRRAEKSGGGG